MLFKFNENRQLTTFEIRKISLHDVLSSPSAYWVNVFLFEIVFSSIEINKTINMGCEQPLEMHINDVILQIARPLE